MAYFGKKTIIQGHFATTKMWDAKRTTPSNLPPFQRARAHRKRSPDHVRNNREISRSPGYWSIASDSWINAGMSAGFLLETRFPSTTTSASTYSAPAFFMSCTSDIQPVTRRPFSTWAVIRSCAAWQIANTGFFLVKNSLANRTAPASIRSLSGD